MNSAPQLNAKRVVTSFEKAAKTYEQVSVLQKEVSNRLQERLDIIKIRPERIIDIGAGTGYAARALEKRFPKAQIVLLDIAKNMLFEAKKNAKWFSKQKFVCADAGAIPLPKHSVDLIFSSLMLHWKADLDVIFKEWLRILKPGGLLLFSIPGPDTLIELRDSFATVDSFPHINPFLDMHITGDALIRAGFADPVLEVENIQMLYADGHQLIRELKMLGVKNSNVAQHKGLMGKNRWQLMLKSYEKFRTQTNKLPATFEVVYAHAWSPEAKKSELDKGEVSVPISKIIRTNS